MSPTVELIWASAQRSGIGRDGGMREVLPRSGANGDGHGSHGGSRAVGQAARLDLEDGVAVAGGRPDRRMPDQRFVEDDGQPVPEGRYALSGEARGGTDLAARGESYLCDVEDVGEQVGVDLAVGCGDADDRVAIAHIDGAEGDPALATAHGSSRDCGRRRRARQPADVDVEAELACV